MEKGNLSKASPTQKLVRPPIVVVVGHVDHGKTSLLDYIRDQSLVENQRPVAPYEIGGITQKIGAFVFSGKEKDITFIDTPGHALFTNMRKRGVRGADIALLVVAGDDGVAPQTKEALKILQESSTPFIAVITKVDLATASAETVLGQLEKEGVYFEKRGGDISWIGVSSKTGEGIDDLLELIALTSDMVGLKGLPTDNLEGFVLETIKDKRGLGVSVVVKAGQIKIGDEIYAGTGKAKVRGIFDDNGKPIKIIMPGYPGLILGFEELPEAGSLIFSKPQVAQEVSLENINGKVQSDAKVKIFVKTKTAGSLEAILANMPEGVVVLGSGVGDLNDSDVFFAKAAGATIFLFEAKVQGSVKRLADTESVKIESFNIVYDFIERLKEIVLSGVEEILGKAQIVAEFPFNGKRIAGSKILSGSISKTSNCRLVRGEAELGKVKIISIKKQKEEVESVGQGEECGILFSPQLDFKVGDVIISVAINSN